MPPALTDPAEWPDMVRPLVVQHGAGRVWAAGLAALGFPPTWAESAAEVVIVRNRLNRP